MSSQQEEPGVLSNDIDPGGGQLSALLFSTPSHGSVALNLDGSFTYTPAANFSGADTFGYTPHGNFGAGGPETVAITVTPVNDRPVGAPDAYLLAKKIDLVVAIPGVLGNDTDIDSGTLTAVLLAEPTNGTLQLAANGSFTYDPDSNNAESDTFTYRPFDGVDFGEPVTVTLIGTKKPKPH